MVSPNTSLTLPDPSDEAASRIQQRSGSIFLEINKRDVDHFEVQTPFLAAVVKGTRFRVSVGPTGSDVEVADGQVRVSDYRSGDVATLRKSQFARVSALGTSGLQLSGDGPLPPIEHGIRTPAPVVPLKVGTEGLVPGADQDPGKLSLGESRGAIESGPSDIADAVPPRREGLRQQPEPSTRQKIVAALSTPGAGLGVGGSFVAGVILSMAQSRRKRREGAKESSDPRSRG